MAIKILIADDNEILREGLLSLFREKADMEVVGEAKDDARAIQLALKLKPDVAVINLDIHKMSGIEAVKRIKNDVPDTKIVAFTTCVQRGFIKEALKAKVSAYVLKEYPFSELARAVRTVMADEVYLSPKVAGIIVDRYIIRDYFADSKTSDMLLTKREREVLGILADGKNTKQTALKLHISSKTVETHRRNIMHKLELYSLPELTKYAIRCGLTSVE